ncbi:ATP-binding protein [Candidatus Woesearchaeota archaeon]|nr:ATP-binding protein [Candidatus Woesearchaeota archaeon]
MRLYVITGGPCSGKTTLLEELGRRRHKFISESAKEVIKEEQAKGVADPWHEKGFQEKIAALQIKKEESIPGGNSIIFLDRALPDGLAYSKFRGQKPPRNLTEAIKKCDYEKVFFLKQLPKYEQNSLRCETEEEAKQVGELIKQVYRQFGYDVIEVPPMSIKERADFVIKNL